MTPTCRWPALPSGQTFLAAMLLCPFVVVAAERPEDVPPGPLTLLFVGGAAGDDSSPTLTRLETRLRSLDPKSGLVVFTGNYAGGELPDIGEEGREQAEKAVLAHVKATADFARRGGRVFYLPGHEDFGEGGAKAVRTLRKFLNRSYRAAGASDDPTGDRDERDVMPRASCGDTTLLELNDSVGLVLVNSQWWMQENLEDPEANQHCEVKSQAAFRDGFNGVLNDYRGRRLIVAMHHPLRSYGELGGAFTGRAHLSPIPIAGSVWVWARQGGLVQQYHAHPMVRSYVEFAFERGQTYGAFVFVSGHDASLQWMTVKKQTQLIAGTSARSARPTVNPADGDFAAPTPGWVELDLDALGAGDAKFISGEEDGKVLFQKQLPPPAAIAEAAGEAAPPVPTGPTLATYSTGNYFHFGSVLKFFAGDLYTDAYALELPYPNLDLQTEQGGLEPTRASGGFQTNGLTLRDPQGGKWSIRSVSKDATRFLAYPLSRFRPLVEIMEHGMTANHPEAALAMPRLLKAVNIPHSEPRMLYLPDQEGLKEYRGYLSNELVLLERKQPEKIPGDESDIRYRSTESLLEKMSQKPDKHRLDQEAMLRARLIDLLVGDSDRHHGQWRFAGTLGADGIRVYQPVPRDRDQVFANYDGFGLAVAKIAAPALRQLQPFNEHYGNLTWLLYGGRNIDPVLLNRLSHARWMAVAKEVKEAVTDQVIDEALATWHPEAYALDGARIAGHLKARRDKLLEVAEAFFLSVNRHAEVLGSGNDDLIELAYQPEGSIRVSIRTREVEEPWFERVYEPKQTDEILIYAREGDDQLKVHGLPHQAIGVRFVGGEGEDFVTSAGERINARAIHLYDSPAGARIDPSIRVADRRSPLAHLNQYDPNENHEPDLGSFLPEVLGSPGDNLYLGGRYTHLVHGYKAAPYAARHEIGAAFATATLGVEADYRGLFPRSAKLLDQEVKLLVRSPTHTRYFFGLTNEYVEPGGERDFYRVRQAHYELRYGLSGTWDNRRARVGVEALGQVIVTEATPGRFAVTSPDVDPGSFGPKYFAGARVFAEVNTFDNPHLPRRGIALHASAEGRGDLERADGISVNFRVAAATAIPLDAAQRFVILSRASVEAIAGKHAFYFAPTIRDTQLRGYQDQQLAGETAFVHTTDLRIDILRFKSGLPSTVGVKASIDHGRVFGSTITGNTYHLNYGGGVWWSILNTIGVSASYYRGLDGGQRFVFGLGPLFEPALF